MTYVLLLFMLHINLHTTYVLEWFFEGLAGWETGKGECGHDILYTFKKFFKTIFKLRIWDYCFSEEILGVEILAVVLKRFIFTIFK